MNKVPSYDIEWVVLEYTIVDLVAFGELNYEND